MDRSGRTLLTGDKERGVRPKWSPDGQSSVVGSSIGGGGENLYRRAADGTGTMTRLTTGPGLKNPSDWSRDGSVLAFVETSPRTGGDIWILDVNDPNHKTRPWLQTTASEAYPRFPQMGGGSPTRRTSRAAKRSTHSRSRGLARAY